MEKRRALHAAERVCTNETRRLHQFIQAMLRLYMPIPPQMHAIISAANTARTMCMWKESPCMETDNTMMAPMQENDKKRTEPGQNKTKAERQQTPRNKTKKKCPKMNCVQKAIFLIFGQLTCQRGDWNSTQVACAQHPWSLYSLVQPRLILIL